MAGLRLSYAASIRFFFFPIFHGGVRGGVFGGLRPRKPPVQSGSAGLIRGILIKNGNPKS